VRERQGRIRCAGELLTCRQVGSLVRAARTTCGLAGLQTARFPGLVSDCLFGLSMIVATSLAVAASKDTQTCPVSLVRRHTAAVPLTGVHDRLAMARMPQTDGCGWQSHCCSESPSLLKSSLVSFSHSRRRVAVVGHPWMTRSTTRQRHSCQPCPGRLVEWISHRVAKPMPTEAILQMCRGKCFLRDRASLMQPTPTAKCSNPTKRLQKYLATQPYCGDLK
jgi:hypothetical protein